jgi:hypothetical protein
VCLRLGFGRALGRFAFTGGRAGWLGGQEPDG